MPINTTNVARPVSHPPNHDATILPITPTIVQIFPFMILISPFPFYFNYVILQERTIFKRTVSLAGNEPSFFTYLESNFSLNLISGYAIVNTKGKPEKRPTLKTLWHYLFSRLAVTICGSGGYFLPLKTV